MKIIYFYLTILLLDKIIAITYLLLSLLRFFFKGRERETEAGIVAFPLTTLFPYIAHTIVIILAKAAYSLLERDHWILNMAPPALSDELRRSGVSALPPRKTKKEKAEAKALRMRQAKAAAKPVMSKSKRKKMEKLAEKKRKKAKRAALYASINASKIETGAELLQKTSSGFNAGETKRQRVKREFREYKILGDKAPSAPSMLYEERRAVSSSEEEEEEDQRLFFQLDERKTVPAHKPIVEKIKPEPTSKVPALPIDPAPKPSVEKVKPEPKPKVPALPIDPALSKPKTVVRVERPKHISESRSMLPVCRMEQEIMEVIEANPVVVLCGETGSGKTTQVPQFLVEAGFGWRHAARNPSRSGIIAVTQPRRVAAVSMAKRVAEELGTKLLFSKLPSPEGGLVGKNDLRGSVGYQVRYDARTIHPDRARLKFMTDGVMLRESKEDILLRKYSVVILDEAHERNLNTDILIGILSRVVPLRAKLAETDPTIAPLKVIVMSATLRVADFAENPRIFRIAGKYPPVVRVEARQFPVTNHFSRRTELHDYVLAAFKKVVAIHRKLPHGAILVFLTGEREVKRLVDALRKKFPTKEVEAAMPRRKRIKRASEKRFAASNKSAGASLGASGSEDSERESDDDDDDDLSKDVEKLSSAESLYGTHGAQTSLVAEDDEDIDYSDIESDDEEGDLEVEGDAGADWDAHIDAERASAPVCALPLYSRLPTHKQLLVFKPPPQGHRMIVVATNVAETSITIPGVKYVVDCGRAKERIFDQSSGSSSFKVGWTSQASADQRKGRAGRVGPGHCYRLYSSAMFNDRMPQFALPEIMRLPVEDLVLYMKSMGILDVDKFPFPTAVSPDAVRKSESKLLGLGALEKRALKNKGEAFAITPLGSRMAVLPLRARVAKMVAVAACDANQSASAVGHVIGVAAALSVPMPFLHLNAIEQGADNEGDDDEEEHEGEEEKMSEKSLQKEKNRLARERARQLHEMWRDGKSDCLSLLRALGAYSHETEKATRSELVEFCMRLQLHHKSMEEMHKLARQLRRMLPMIASGSAAAGAKLPRALPPPSGLEKEYIRQVVTAGSLDCVARKMTRDQVRLMRNVRGAKGWPYEACSLSVPEPVFIHHHSHVHADAKHLPEWIVYSEIVKVEVVGYGDDSARVGEDAAEKEDTNTVSYVKGITAISPSWLHGLSKGLDSWCELSPPMESPSPEYDAKSDSVICCVVPVFGPKRWSLPPMWIPYPSASEDERLAHTRWFARLLFEGRIASPSAFAALAPVLSFPPPHFTLASTMHSALPHGFVRSLLKRGVRTKRALVRACTDNPTFLKNELRSATKRQHRHGFEAEIWPAFRRAVDSLAE